ncbi:MAG TPA: outer membrane beta-barrel protein [Solimonas sp.]|nr:outer membrane beta-barrel protein [Solimonas sp.]
MAKRIALIPAPVVHPHGWRRCVCAAALLWSGAGLAEFETSEWGGAEIVYNSNVFEAASGQDGLRQDGNDEAADTIMRFQGGARVVETLGQQKLRATGQVGQVMFQRFGELDHVEHHLDGAFDWKLGSVVDGEVEYRHDRRRATFAEVDNSVLTLQTEQAGRASLNAMATPSWRVESGIERRVSDLPLPDGREFRFSEDTGRVGLKFLGLARVTAGLAAEAARGEFSGLADAATYDQFSLKLAATYAHSEESRLEGELGMVQRTQQPSGSGEDSKVNTLEGKLAYKRAFTVKSSAEVELFRRVESYLAGSSALVETGVAAAAAWLATEKIAAHARAGLTRGEFQTEQGRVDDYYHAGVDVGYQVLDWCLLRAFGEYRERASNLAEGEFAATIAGLELRLQFQQQ